MKFETVPEIDNWVKIHSEHCKSNVVDGAQFIYEFIPTAIVEVQTVTCAICKEKHTAYND